MLAAACASRACLPARANTSRCGAATTGGVPLHLTHSQLGIRLHHRPLHHSVALRARRCRRPATRRIDTTTAFAVGGLNLPEPLQSSRKLVCSVASISTSVLARLAAIPLTIIDALFWSLLSLLVMPFFAVANMFTSKRATQAVGASPTKRNFFELTFAQRQMTTARRELRNYNKVKRELEQVRRQKDELASLLDESQRNAEALESEVEEYRMTIEALMVIKSQLEKKVQARDRQLSSASSSLMGVGNQMASMQQQLMEAERTTDALESKRQAARPARQEVNRRIEQTYDGNDGEGI